MQHCMVKYPSAPQTTKHRLPPMLRTNLQHLQRLPANDAVGTHPETDGLQGEDVEEVSGRNEHDIQTPIRMFHKPSNSSTLLSGFHVHYVPGA